MSTAATPFRLADRQSRGRRWLDAVAIVGLAFAGLVAIILWFDNAQGGLTGNGVFKSLELKEWVDDPANAPLYPSNYLFYPAYGVLCRLLDLLGVFVGDPRRQMTILNAASASLCAAVVYLVVREITGSRPIGWLTALFHLASNFVLFLAITNEDIMSSYTILFASMALAAVWFAQPSTPRVVVVSALFTIGWLFEWRLMFPTLPAMLAALWLCERRLAMRFVWIALFLATMFALTAVVALLWQNHRGAVDAFELFYTGKGVNSVWSGFTWPKVWYMWEGVVGYVLGTAVTTLPGGWDIWRYVATIWMVAVAAIALPILWRSRQSPLAWSMAAVFGGTFAAGTVFNLYSQPHDPQMQINVLGWLTIGWGLVLAAASRRWGAKGLGALAGLTVGLAAYNVWSLAPLRGVDGAWAEATKRIEQQTDPARTVFLLHGFDWPMIYLCLHWGKVDQGIDRLKPAPQAEPKLKWLAVIGGTWQHPDWTGERHAAALRANLDKALDLGYTLVASEVWAWDEARLDALSGTSVPAATSIALRNMLHADYVAEPLYTDPVAGPFFKLKKRPGR